MDDETRKVLSVSEGVGSQTAGAVCRVFSVVLDRPCNDGELSVVAAARDPETRDAIPAPGTPHPNHPELMARPPLIYPVGSRDKHGARLTAKSNFYNVRVPYIKRGEGT